MTRFLLLLLIAGLAACSSAPGNPRSEAGSEVDGGNFGNANMNNTQVMTGERGYVSNLSERFAREVPTTVNFAFDSAHLDAKARERLSVQAAWIRQFPEVRFKVFGHTDAVGSDEYNKALGMRRAKAVVHFLASQGVSTSRLEAVVSFGSQQPVIVTQGRERRNRRTVTEVSGFVQSHPTILNGKYAEVIFREYVESATAKPKIAMAQSAATTAAE